MHRINSDLISVLNWFSNNEMVTKPDKFQTFLLGTTDGKISLDIETAKIIGSKKS